MKSNPAPAIVVINRLHKSLLQTNSSHGVNCIRRERGGEREREGKKKTDEQTNKQTANKLASYNGKTFPRRGHVERVEVARVRNGQSVFRCSSASFQTRPPPSSPGADRSVEHSQRFVDQRSIQRSVQPFTKLEIRGRQADKLVHPLTLLSSLGFSQ